MASLMDTLSGLAQQFTTQGQATQGKSGGLGGVLGGLANSLGGQNGPQGHSGSNGPSFGAGTPQSSSAQGALGGLGGLLGSAALGGVFGALLTNKGVRKIAGNALLVGGGAVAATMAWKYFQKWNAGNSSTQSQTGQEPLQATVHHTPAQSLPQRTTHNFGPLDTAASNQRQSNGQNLGQNTEQEQLAETLLMAMVFAARSDGHIDEQEQANIDTILNAMPDGDESKKKVYTLIHRPINPDELAARVRTREEAEDLYRLSCLIVHIDQYMERSYMDGLAKALQLSETETHELQRQAEDIKKQAGA